MLAPVEAGIWRVHVSGRGGVPATFEVVVEGGKERREDFILEDFEYNDLDTNFTGHAHSNGDNEDEFKIRLEFGKRFNKRQAGFPGDDNKTDKSK